MIPNYCLFFSLNYQSYTSSLFYNRNFGQLSVSGQNPTMNKNSTNSVYPKWSKDYVDIHGRDLKAMIADDGSIFIPLQEIRKSGFHVFPKSEFLYSKVNKSMAMSELRMYLLGAAREFIVQNSISLFNKEDIQDCIERSREQLINDNAMADLNSSKPTILGRSLLTDPVTINKEVRSALLRNNQHILNDNPNKNENQNNRLRLPHKGRFINQNQQQQNQSGNGNRLNGNFVPNAAFAAKNESKSSAMKRDSDCKSASEIDDSETFLKLSDCKVDRIKLQKTTQKVQVVHVETSNDKRKYWIHLLDHEDQVLNILEKCQEAAVYTPTFTPKLGDFCMAMSAEDESWNRAVVQRVNSIIKVHFIDFGNNAVVSKVKKIPEDIRSIAAQAVRIVFSKDVGSKEFNVGDIVSVKVIKEFGDGTYVVCEDSQLGALKSEIEVEKCFWEQTVYSKSLIDGEIVRIIAYKEGKLYLQNREHFMKLKDIAGCINDLTKQPVKSVEPKQLVVCRKDGEEQMCRAVIKSVDDGFVTVHFIDFHTNDSMSVKALYAAPKALLGFPVALIESPTIKGYSDIVGLTDAAEEAIDDAILKKLKFNVLINGTEFDLVLNGQPFSEVLFPAITPTSSFQAHNDQKSEVSSSSSPPKPLHPPERTMYLMMTPYVAPTGVGDYLLNFYKDSQEFTVTSTGDAETEMLSKCTCIELDDDEGPYEPLETEMVLGRFEGDWYRGVVLDVCADGKYQIIFVEYGNTLELTKEDIRKFPHSLKSIPILGLSCKMDVPQTKAVNKRLEQLLKEGNIYEIDFISGDSEDEDVHTVKIPKVEDILKKEGLL